VNRVGDDPCPDQWIRGLVKRQTSGLILLLLFGLTLLRCDPEVYNSYVVDNQTDSDYLLNFATFYVADSSVMVAAGAQTTIYDEGYWGTDVIDVGDSIHNVIPFLKLFDLDSNLLYEQNPTQRSEWAYEERQNAFLLFVNMGGWSRYTFTIREAIF